MPHELSKLPDYVTTLIAVGAILVGAFLLTWIVRAVIRRIVGRITRGSASDGEGARRARTIGSVLRTAASALIWPIAVLMALSRAGVNIAPLVAAAGIGGLAIGFGAQSLVKDVVSGFYILVEDQYRVGDVIAVAGVQGTVEQISLRATTLRSADGAMNVVPNGEIRVATNLSKGFSRAVVDVPIHYEADLDRVTEIVHAAFDALKADPKWSGVIAGPLEVLGIDSFGETNVVFTVRTRTLPGKQWEVGRELRARIKRALNEAGIWVTKGQTS